MDVKVHHSKKRHFTLKFVRMNLAQYAALVTLAGHVFDEPSLVGYNASLLRNPVGSAAKRFTPVRTDLKQEEIDALPTTDISFAEGCYLYYDTVNAQWIRSGKVAGTTHNPKGILARHLEHKDKAERNEAGSDLYDKYPAKQSANAVLVRQSNLRPYPWNAYFEDLALFCGLGFIRSDSVVSRLTSIDGGEAKGLFMWDDSIIDALNNWDKNGQTTMVDKQLHMVAYLLELGYELLLSDDANVSTMPGFENFGLPNFSKR